MTKFIGMKDRRMDAGLRSVVDGGGVAGKWIWILENGIGGSL